MVDQVEKVARAICKEAGEHWFGSDYYVGKGENERWLKAARAAITAYNPEADFWAATEEVMHFINSLDSSGMDANAVRSAIYHKCLGMRPADTAYNPNERLREALEAITEAVGVTLDKDFGFWSSPTQNERRHQVYSAWTQARAALVRTSLAAALSHKD